MSERRKALTFDRHTPIDAGARWAEMEREAALRKASEAADEIGRILRGDPPPTPAQTTPAEPSDTGSASE